MEHATFAEMLRERAERQPEATAFEFLEEERTIGYAELDARARSIAAGIQASLPAGERVLVTLPPGEAYVSGVFGCLYAGAVAVPAYPADPAQPERASARLRAIAADARPAAVLTADPADGAALAPVVLAPAAPDDWRPAGARPSDVALLQYTSGSTASPRGVMVTHANLLHNSELIRRAFGHSPESRGVSWLPPYHDMGLIGAVLQPVYAGFPCTLMSPLTYLRRPLRWLQTVSERRATSSGGPDSAFARCARHAGPEERARLDLSAWEVAFTGSEPVREETIDAFTAAFADCGFRREAFLPCYGLAEATLMVTGRRGPRFRGGVASCGPAGHGACVTIAAEDGEGEIRVTGGGVAAGYWGRPAETAAAFAGGELRTGDLGVLRDGELYVTGRIKDVMIAAGRNHHAADIERACEAAVPALRPGAGAAFAVDDGGREHVAVVYEVAETPALDSAAMIRDVRLAVARAEGLTVDRVVLVSPRSVPRTSSGKVQRSRCRALLLAGDLDVVAAWSRPG